MPSTLTQNKPLYDGLKVTREEYLDLKDDGYKYDMINGVLHMSPSAFSEHGESQISMATMFFNYFRKNKSGKVIGEVDIYLPDGGDVLRPDITVILRENYNIIKGHIHGVPDIVVEVLSESTKKRDLGVKADRYLKNGVKEYWIVNPDEKTIALWVNRSNQSGENYWQKEEADKMESSILSGFVVDKTEIFSES